MDEPKKESKLKVMKDLLVDNKGLMEKVLPKYLTADRMVAIALSAVSRTPQLLSCTPASICRAVMQGAELGLETGSPLGHAYLVPFFNSQIKGYEAQFMIGYKGLIHLALANGSAISFEARAVYDKDKFEYGFGTTPHIDHTPALSNAGKLTHVYAVVKTDKGATLIDVMTIDEVERVKARSKAKDSGPWKTDYVAMAKKTVCKRMQPYLNLSAKAEKAFNSDPDQEIELPDGEIIDMTTGEVMENGSQTEEAKGTDVLDEIKKESVAK